VTLKEGDNEFIILADNPNQAGFTHVIIKTSNLYGARKSLKGRRKDRTRSSIREAEMKSGQLKITPGLTLQIYYGPKTV
jgi:hypothetical protein